LEPRETVSFKLAANSLNFVMATKPRECAHCDGQRNLRGTCLRIALRDLSDRVERLANVMIPVTSMSNIMFYWRDLDPSHPVKPSVVVSRFAGKHTS
jgi:hypothetical protein